MKEIEKVRAMYLRGVITLAEYLTLVGEELVRVEQENDGNVDLEPYLLLASRFSWHPNC